MVAHELPETITCSAFVEQPGFVLLYDSNDYENDRLGRNQTDAIPNKICLKIDVELRL